MAFNPDAFLADSSIAPEPPSDMPTEQTGGFDPDAFLGAPSEGEPMGQFKSLQQIREEAATPQPEANVAEAMGRGMMDVYQGGKQLSLAMSEKKAEALQAGISRINEFADIQFSPNSFQNKALKSLAGGLAYLVPEANAEKYHKQLSEELALYNQSNPEIQASRILGSIATPLSLVPGGPATSFGGKLLTGAATGSVFSLFQPVDDPEGNPDEYWAQKGEQALWGGGIGAGIPVAGKVFGAVAGWVDEVTKPLYKKGIIRDVSKYLKEYVTENKDKITSAIQRAINEGDDRTVGQIIADTVKGTGDDFGGLLVRLEKDLARTSDSLKSLYARQNKRITGFLDNLAGADDDLARATSIRANNGTQNYEKAFKQAVRPDEELMDIVDNKFAKSAMKSAQDMIQAEAGKLRAEGINPVTKGLHYMKLGLDKELAKTGDQALSKAEKKVVGEVKDRLVSWLEKKNPAYDAARKQYQIDSIPINRMEVGRGLRNLFVGSLEDNKPSVFANGVRDAHRVIKKATGNPRYESLDDIFSPEEVSKIYGIVDDLAVNKKAAEMASKSGNIMGKLPGEIEVHLPHILSRPIVITNHILDRLGQDKTGEYKRLLSELVQNPDEFIRAFSGPGEWERTKMAADIVRRLNTMAASSEAGKEVGAQ